MSFYSAPVKMNKMSKLDLTDWVNHLVERANIELSRALVANDRIWELESDLKNERIRQEDLSKTIVSLQKKLAEVELRHGSEKTRRMNVVRRIFDIMKDEASL